MYFGTNPLGSAQIAFSLRSLKAQNAARFFVWTFQYDRSHWALEFARRAKGSCMVAELANPTASSTRFAFRRRRRNGHDGGSSQDVDVRYRGSRDDGP